MHGQLHKRRCKGNLQYQASGAVWQFAERQCDIIGMENDGISDTYTGWIDLFGWGTSGWSSGADAYMPYSTDLVDSHYCPGGDDSADFSGIYANADWGRYNPIENGGNVPGMWRTLSKDEWNYLFVRRAGAADKYALAKVDGVDGVVLLPDEWVLPEGIEFTAGVENGYKTNKYTSSKWSKMQDAGAVFLPAAGYREETTVFTRFYSDGNNEVSCGFYWSSTPLSSINCNIVFFGKEKVNPQNFSKRHFGLSVRLVKDC